jgi:hypothetical protein
LADGGTGLEFGKDTGTPVIAQRAHPRAHRAGRDHDDFLAGFALRGDLGDQLLELRQIRLLAAVREDAGSEFDDHAGDIFQQFATHASLVTKGGAGVEFGKFEFRMNFANDEKTNHAVPAPFDIRHWPFHPSACANHL